MKQQRQQAQKIQLISPQVGANPLQARLIDRKKPLLDLQKVDLGIRSGVFELVVQTFYISAVLLASKLVRPAARISL